MSDPDKPLHVRVAEALTGQQAVLWHFSETRQRPVLGPNQTGKTPGAWAFTVCVRDPGFQCELVGGQGLLFAPPSYDTDWSATGSLIEKYGIMLVDARPGWLAMAPNHVGYGDVWVDVSVNDVGDAHATPLVAVCHLLLALKEAGKL